MVKGIVIYKIDYIGKLNEICRFIITPDKNGSTLYEVHGNAFEKNGLPWSKIHFLNLHITYKEFHMNVDKVNPKYSRVKYGCTKFEAEQIILKIKYHVDRRTRFTYSLISE